MAQKHHRLIRSCLHYFLIIGVFGLIVLAEGAVFAQREAFQEIRSIADQLKESHGLELAWQDIGPIRVDGVVFEEISSSEMGRLLTFLRIFRDEIGKYPASFFDNTGLSRVFLVKKLFFENDPARGIYRAPEGYMFFDIYRDFDNELAQRHGIHHEIYHMIDTSIKRGTVPFELIVQTGGGTVPLENWSTFNPPDFSYQKKGRWHGARNQLNFFAPQVPGFVTEYSYVSEEEDKAEIYACLFIESQHRLMYRWAQKDDILARKIEAMKGLIEQFCPEMDENYWDNLFK